MGQGLPNPDLQTEKATHFDVSFQYGMLRNLSLNGSVYYIRLHDVIQLVNDVEGNLTQIQNAGKARFRGVRCKLHYTILKNLDLISSYSFIIQKIYRTPIYGLRMFPNTRCGTICRTNRQIGQM